MDSVTEFTVCGKFSLIIFCQMRSCHDSSTEWARFVVTSASVFIDLVLVFKITLEKPSTFIWPPSALNS